MNDLISVILPVYNGESYLLEAIDSILVQSYSNFELIIINDGSTDKSWEIISKFNSSSKVKAINQANIGLAATLNKGIRLSLGQYIARMDQDDISLPDRLFKQIEFLKSNSNCNVVGTWAQIIEQDSLSQRTIKHPTSDHEIKTYLLFDSPFVHPSTLIRKDALIKAGLYSEDRSLQPPEDYELWTRMAHMGQMSNISEILLYYREIPSSMSRTPKYDFCKKVINSSLRYIQHYGLNPHEFNILPMIYHGISIPSADCNLKIILEKYNFLYSKIHPNLDFKEDLIAQKQRNQLRVNYFKLKYGKISSVLVRNFLSFVQRFGVKN